MLTPLYGSSPTARRSAAAYHRICIPGVDDPSDPSGAQHSWLDIDPTNCTTEQLEAFDLLLNTNANLFITGGAGVGKSALLMTLVRLACRARSQYHQGVAYQDGNTVDRVGQPEEDEFDVDANVRDPHGSDDEQYALTFTATYISPSLPSLALPPPSPSSSSPPPPDYTWLALTSTTSFAAVSLSSHGDVNFFSRAPAHTIPTAPIITLSLETTPSAALPVVHGRDDGEDDVAVDTVETVHDPQDYPPATTSHAVFGLGVSPDQWQFFAAYLDRREAFGRRQLDDLLRQKRFTTLNAEQLGARTTLPPELQSQYRANRIFEHWIAHMDTLREQDLLLGKSPPSGCEFKWHARYEKTIDRLCRMECWVLDEVSMVNPVYWISMAWITARVRTMDLWYNYQMTTAAVREMANTPFGGIRVIVVGDFLQLPPVVAANDITSIVSEYQVNAWCAPPQNPLASSAQERSVPETSDRPALRPSPMPPVPLVPFTANPSDLPPYLTANTALQPNARAFQYFNPHDRYDPRTATSGRIDTTLIAPTNDTRPSRLPSPKSTVWPALQFGRLYPPATLIATLYEALLPFIGLERGYHDGANYRPASFTGTRATAPSKSGAANRRAATDAKFSRKFFGISALPSATAPYPRVDAVFPRIPSAAVHNEIMASMPPMPPDRCANNLEQWLAIQEPLPNPRYAFQTAVWERLDFQPIVLTKIYRQGGDLAYAECLNRIRMGSLSVDDLIMLHERVQSLDDDDNNNGNGDDDNGDTYGGNGALAVQPTHVCARVLQVRETNQARLAKLVAHWTQHPDPAQRTAYPNLVYRTVMIIGPYTYGQLRQAWCPPKLRRSEGRSLPRYIDAHLDSLCRSTYARAVRWLKARGESIEYLQRMVGAGGSHDNIVVSKAGGALAQTIYATIRILMTATRKATLDTSWIDVPLATMAIRCAQTEPVVPPSRATCALLDAVDQYMATIQPAVHIMESLRGVAPTGPLSTHASTIDAPITRYDNNASSSHRRRQNPAFAQSHSTSSPSQPLLTRLMRSTHVEYAASHYPHLFLHRSLRMTHAVDALLVMSAVNEKVFRSDSSPAFRQAPTLELCCGAQVRLTAALDIARGLANGTRGIVIGFYHVVSGTVVRSPRDHLEQRRTTPSSLPPHPPPPSLPPNHQSLQPTESLSPVAPDTLVTTSSATEPLPNVLSDDPAFPPTERPSYAAQRSRDARSASTTRGSSVARRYRYLPVVRFENAQLAPVDKDGRQRHTCGLISTTPLAGEIVAPRLTSLRDQTARLESLGSIVRDTDQLVRAAAGDESLMAIKNMGSRFQKDGALVAPRTARYAPHRTHPAPTAAYAYDVDDQALQDLRSLSVYAMHLPLELEWAITAHGSQGCTHHSIRTSIGEQMMVNQAYVILSRVTSSQGLFLDHFDPKGIQACPQAVQFYAELEYAVRMRRSQMQS